jgi:formylglycine-generating enzyme required for sulfatase activity
MPIDFTQIETGEKFELLCEDLLRAMGFTIVQKPARGPDGGTDLIVSQILTDMMGFAEQRKTVVQCKHWAKGGKAIPFTEVSNYREAMDQAKVRRYLLITSTLPTQDLQDKFKAVTETGDYIALIWSANDLTRLLDAHPDIRDCYFPTEPELPTPADDLAHTVEGLLRAMGFTCLDHEQIDPLRVSIPCQGSKPFAQRMLVVCKEGTVERPDVEDLLAYGQAQNLDRAVLVTHTRVTPAARDRAAETDGLIQAFTLDAFYRELINFEPYVHQLVSDYDGSDLAAYYVDLGCRTGDGSEIKPMDGYIDAWLDDPARNHISILGDYGTGKTSFCRQYAAELGRRWLADPDHNRIPILISLRDYAKTMGLQQLITDFLVNRYGIHAPYEAFVRFNADGKLVLLFDGFDEMAQKVDYQTTVDNFEELAKAVVPGSKVILTCRTPYFRTRKEAERIFSSRGAEAVAGADDLPDRPLIDLTDRPNFEIVHLLPFDDGDIRAILRKRFPAEWEGFWRQIQDTYNLPELAQRPVLLDMIACSLPELEPGQALNAAKLYEAYTDLWLKRDEDKGRHLITRDDKRLFMQALALEMLRRQELSIHYLKLPERVQDHFHLDKEREVDYFDSDIRTCSFLNRDPEGNYRFLHKSFGEFFVAQWLAPKLLDTTAPEMRINEEIRGFVHGLLEGAPWPPPPPEGVTVPDGMVWVPPGPFIMGGEYGFDVQVAHIARGFFVSLTPVTNAQYARFVEATGRESPEHWKGKTPPGELHNHPVVHVTWHDAVAYAEWAGERLLTEEEWEKAARGIDGREYPWGDGEPTPHLCNFGGNEGGTTPVGRYSPQGDSPYGCADMAGNVWEWTASDYDDKRKVLRGGSWRRSPDYVRGAIRYWFPPVGRYVDDGFRCARGSE